ncbi:LacI family DNA-binding transcriptional regulator [Streptomyces sp. CRN 30]|uniref:LacI family DNA-binding transcriptional regulator n=1 Tax=Streptomyces sp. CRN 30 TaxID=3075613 RepID=UPI002A81FCE3|nr:LacI family DNA-binding transcriptional regulator [Streptomyces sp. CRN 30]
MATITDVARRAGVSPSTVSYALSGKRPISAGTRRRVEEAVRELGYRPYAGGPSRVLGLLLPPREGMRAPAALECAASVVTTARAHGHDVLLLTGEDGGRAPHPLPEALIVMAAEPRGPLPPPLRGRPAVLIGVPAEPRGAACVDLDFLAAGERCAELLARLGHRTVALVGAEPEAYVRRTTSAHRVVRGFTAAAGRAGLVHSVHPGARDPRAARETAERLLRLRPVPTGVVVHNEPLLGPLVDAFTALGLRVPGDLSVTAICRDGAALAARVPVSSVPVPSAALGARAVELAVRSLAGATVPSTTLLPARLTERASTAAPA